jgi:type VI secretion system secreted protein VgrG
VEVAHATSELVGIGVGMTFELTLHPVAELNRKWLVVAARHEGTNAGQAGETRGADGKGPAVEYLNHLELIPAEREYRPKRTLFKKRVFGVMTATVTGPKGEEIYTDKQGRIKVQFHWDREGKLDEKTSCFVRSMQPWAGTGWGVSFLPRIGMEVVVNFIDGDIDKPLVVGTVYNGTHAPPYVPEGDAGALTKSTIKSQSTPGGTSANFNEIRFEDQIGKEEIFIQAEKDMNEKIKKSHSRSVGAGESISVGGDRSLSVGKDESITVKGKQTTTVTGTCNIHADGDITIDTPGKITLKGNNSTMVLEAGKITLTSGGNSTVVLDVNAFVQSSGASHMLLDANACMQSSGGARVLLDPNALVHSSDGSYTLLSADAELHASTGATVSLTADATMTGANAMVKADTSAEVHAPTATLAGGGGKVEAAAAGVKVAGGQVDVSGSMVNVTGGMVSIN